MIGKYDRVLGGNELPYHKDDTMTIHGNASVPNVGININMIQYSKNYVEFLILGLP